MPVLRANCTFKSRELKGKWKKVAGKKGGDNFFKKKEKVY